MITMMPLIVSGLRTQTIAGTKMIRRHAHQQPCLAVGMRLVLVVMKLAMNARASIIDKAIFPVAAKT